MVISASTYGVMARYSLFPSIVAFSSSQHGEVSLARRCHDRLEGLSQLAINKHIVVRHCSRRGCGNGLAGSCSQVMPPAYKASRPIEYPGRPGARMYGRRETLPFRQLVKSMF